MSILVNKNTRVVTQGITGATGQFHTRACKEYGTQMVGGRGARQGRHDFEGIPIFDTVEQARKATGANATVIYVPPPFAADAILEAVAAGIELVICITEGMPVLDMVKVKRYMQGSKSAPDRPELSRHHHAGRVQDRHHAGLHPQARARSAWSRARARSPTRRCYQLTQLGIGQSTCIGIGGDPIIGTTHIDALRAVQRGSETPTRSIMIGEIGGTAEEEAAEYVKQHVKKPVVAFIAGQTAPKGRRMGHAGAIISGGRGTAADKIAALKAAGISGRDEPGRDWARR